jgi:hypothetical protein
MEADLEKNLQNFAIYSSKNFKLAPIGDILSGYNYKLLGHGQWSRVYKIKYQNWVIKEGKWDREVDLRLFKFQLPDSFAEPFKNFSINLTPEKKEVLRQFDEYLIFINYFGVFEENENSFFHPELKKIIKKQTAIREKLKYSIAKIEKKHKIKFNKKLEKVLNSKQKFHNFLPKEYLLYGKSITKENKGKPTSFIFQEYIKGEMLHDKSDDKLPKDKLYQLIILIYLILYMHYETGLIPDTRPRSAFEFYNWITKTDNIIISDQGLKFIDTRWFWSSNGNIFKKGFLVTDLVLTLAKNYLNYLLRFV